MYCRKSSNKSARTFRFAASSAPNPTSLNTLSLPWVACISLALLPRLAIVPGRSITLPTDLDVLLGRLLRFLLERVEYINYLLELSDIENTVLSQPCAGLLAETGAHRPATSPSTRWVCHPSPT